MSTICIDNTSIGGKGFVNSQVVRSQIEDAQKASGVSLNKMGTSIPTPYARLFLFISAFSEINSKQKEDAYNAHIGITAYHALISEWLDMMEFIFVYGHDRHNFQIIPWGASDVDLLKHSNDPKHVKLAEALQDGIDNTPKLKGYNKIYIFRYNNVILGGTSPLSLVYSSPNWRRQNTNEFYRGSGGHLFDEQIVPLHQRDIDFRRFVHKYIEKFGQTLSKEITTYVVDNRNQYDVEIKKEFDDAIGRPGGYAKDFDDKYESIKDVEGASVTIGNMQIFCKKDIIVDVDSQYEIIATCKRYATEIVNGEPLEVKTPLVLSKHGMDGAIYWKGLKWASYDIDSSLPSTLSTRQLPGFFGTTYPFVTIDDFLEDKIVEVSYDLHRNKFFTGNRGLTHFLLPLKKEIFKFFEPKDLFVVDGLTGAVTPTDMFSIEEIDADSDDRKVVARLNIPTKYGRNMEFVREYTNDSIVDCFDFRSAFDLAFFPFYKMIGGGKNVYNIMLGYKGDEKTAEFFSLNDLTKPVPKQENLRSRGVLKTVHIHLEDAFDVVELNVTSSNAKGLIVPIMCEKDVTANQRQYVFCVDFGTTNTHIAYGYSQGGNGNINRDRVQPLDVTEDDLQTVYLNNHEKGSPNAGFGQFSEFLTPALREFVPCVIGDGLFKLPMRTAVCEIPNLTTAEPKIFGNINVGFNYLNEIGSNKDCIYRTDIKWSASDSDPKAKDRVKMFFKELMWIMKNKAVMNGGRPDFKLVFTYPQSMRKSLIGKFHGLWNDARIEVGATMSNIKNVNESLNIQALEGVAPYFSFLPELQFGETYANVDIGGGTSDIIYINPIDGGEKISYSAIFAANDIWGDGTNPAVSKQNGFLKGYLNSTRYANLSDEDDIKEHLRAFMDDTASGSSDVISYLFSKDKYGFSDYLEGSELKVLLLVHLSSVIYYMALAILRDGVEVPHHITFTGMGSKYIPFIGDASCLNEIITKIFEYRLSRENFDVKKIDVRFADDPKRVTAAGGVVMSSGSTIDPERNLVYGWENEGYSNKRIKIEDIASRKTQLFNEFERFLDMFEDEDFIALVLDNTDINTRGLKAKIMQFAENSFKQMQILQNGLAAKGTVVNLEEPMFFWPLKDSIFQLGRQMASSNQ